MDNFYNKEKEGGINPLDKKLNINWEIDLSKANILERDLSHPNLEDLETCF